MGKCVWKVLWDTVGLRMMDKHSTQTVSHIGDPDVIMQEAVCTPASPEALAEAQATDAELTVLLQRTTALRLEKVQVPGSDVALHCDTLRPSARPRLID
jgi:hypothetical protein